MLCGQVYSNQFACFSDLLRYQNERFNDTVSFLDRCMLWTKYLIVLEVFCTFLSLCPSVFLYANNFE